MLDKITQPCQVDGVKVLFKKRLNLTWFLQLYSMHQASTVKSVKQYFLNITVILLLFYLAIVNPLGIWLCFNDLYSVSPGISSTVVLLWLYL